MYEPSHISPITGLGPNNLTAAMLRPPLAHAHPNFMISPIACARPGSYGGPGSYGLIDPFSSGPAASSYLTPPKPSYRLSPYPHSRSGSLAVSPLPRYSSHRRNSSFYINYTQPDSPSANSYSPVDQSSYGLSSPEPSSPIYRQYFQSTAENVQKIYHEACETFTEKHGEIASLELINKEELDKTTLENYIEFCPNEYLNPVLVKITTKDKTDEVASPYFAILTQKNSEASNAYTLTGPSTGIILL